MDSHMNGHDRRCKHDFDRRAFLRIAATAGAFCSAFADVTMAEGGEPLRAAVIGHTGRGDYGHGLESSARGRRGHDGSRLAPV